MRLRAPPVLGDQLKVALLNAEQEVELAKRIEAGLFAEEKLGKEFAGFDKTKKLARLVWTT